MRLRSALNLDTMKIACILVRVGIFGSKGGNMVKQGINRLSRSHVWRPVERRINGKEIKKIMAFTSMMDRKLEQLIKVIMNTTAPCRITGLNRQFCSKIKPH